jgi:hypothetical protein
MRDSLKTMKPEILALLKFVEARKSANRDVMVEWARTNLTNNEHLGPDTFVDALIEEGAFGLR